MWIGASGKEGGLASILFEKSVKSRISSGRAAISLTGKVWLIKWTDPWWRYGWPKKSKCFSNNTMAFGYNGQTQLWSLAPEYLRTLPKAYNFGKGSALDRTSTLPAVELPL